MSVESNRRHFVAGLYTAYSDVVGKHLGASESFLAPFLIHNLDPLKAGIAGCLISFTATKCHRFIISWLPKSAQDSMIFHATTHTFSYLAVGAAFGAASALLLPAAGITATAGVALGFSAFVGMAVDAGIKSIVVEEYFIKKKKLSIPFPENETVLNACLTLLCIPFSDAVIRCFLSPSSFLGPLLIHNVQSLVRSLLPSYLISVIASVTYATVNQKLLTTVGMSDSKLAQFIIKGFSYLLAGALVGLVSSILSLLEFKTSGFFFFASLVGPLGPLVISIVLLRNINIQQGIALGMISFVGPPLIRLACKVAKTFYVHSALHTYLTDFDGNRVTKDLFVSVSEEGKMCHQADLYRRCLYGSNREFNIPIFLAEEDKTPIDENQFKDWKSKNKPFWKSVTKGTICPALRTRKPTQENFSGIRYALTKNDLPSQSGVLVCPYKNDENIENNIIIYDNESYAAEYIKLDNELKKDPKFNFKALAVIGNRHWEVMDIAMKTEEFILESAFKNRRLLFGIDSEVLRNILPAFIGHRDFLPSAKSFPDLFKLSAKAYNFKEGDLIKGSRVFLLCIKVLNKKVNMPKPIRNKIVVYTLYYWGK